MWEPFREHSSAGPNCRIVHDKFHIMQHANEAIDEVRRAEFFRKGGAYAGWSKEALAVAEPVDQSDRWQAPELNQLFALNRKAFKATSSRESDRLDVPL
jgi:transposase